MVEDSGAGRARSMTDLLRAVSPQNALAPPFDPADAPDDPVVLFTDWFADAVDAGEPEPQAMSVATVAPDGTPSARVVVLRDLYDGTWWFATDSRTRKSQDVRADPRAAASFHWPGRVRHVRLTGRVRTLPAEECAADLARRSPASRAAAVAARPEQPLRDPADLAAALTRARERTEADPTLGVETWVVHGIVPEEVEFWQGDPDWVHLRLAYRRRDQGWTRELLWP